MPAHQSTHIWIDVQAFFIHTVTQPFFTMAAIHSDILFTRYRFPDGGYSLKNDADWYHLCSSCQGQLCMYDNRQQSNLRMIYSQNQYRIWFKVNTTK